MKRSNKYSFLVPNGDNSQITRNDFPPDFTFGTGTSAYQHEGAATRGDRVADGSNANVTVDMYDRFKEDIDYMKKMGLDAFRFSISWPRVLPGGRRAAGVNKEGIKFYNEVIDTLLANELCFWEFGDRVKYWVTLNEPWSYTTSGYAQCLFPPSPPQNVPGSLENIGVTYKASKKLLSLYQDSNAAGNTAGVDEVNNPKLTPRKACVDPIRVKYHQDHLANILLAMTRDGVNVKGYFVWSWCDNFEWTTGYLARFGLMYVDYKNDLARYPKDSALWFAKFLVRMPKTPSNKRIANFVDTESQKKLRAMEE
ncbi:hypothetical protein BUALT_Bualt01G0075300 [Buddleja alternifolia]|uniref:Beta-glucosidase n=1 Tax=Buddleja alternifolia TaxID=168488 RepID=A0AAV6Y678_9LAMI|nr:hypothetical protein BUALT_Bualt01G0075300 [Buddleja alternifolia]